MNDLIDMIASEQSPVEISDKIKELLMQKAVERIEVVKPHVSASMFGLDDSSEEE